MKRKLEDLFENLCINKKSRTQIVPRLALQDPFDIGPIEFKSVYTYDDVVRIINARETTLKAKFMYFMDSMRKNSWMKVVSADNVAHIVQWIK